MHYLGELFVEPLCGLMKTCAFHQLSLQPREHSLFDTTRKRNCPVIANLAAYNRDMLKYVKWMSALSSTSSRRCSINSSGCCP
ncbi:hypothetical protein LSAT2_000554 [Lamellibrachia satsuma]|nr:hypothetical protein LSAT2_000554 [Lamellibrachia satsuma]